MGLNLAIVPPNTYLRPLVGKLLTFPACDIEITLA